MLRRRLRKLPHIFHTILRMLDYAHFNLLPETVTPLWSSITVANARSCVGFSSQALRNECHGVEDCMWDSRGDLVVHVNRYKGRELWLFR